VRVFGRAGEVVEGSSATLGRSSRRVIPAAGSLDRRPWLAS
jgi:hypothetical protein